MEVEHDILVIPLDDKDRLQREIDAKAKEGWMLVPGVRPVAIYHVVRQKPAPMSAQFAQGTMIIDDSKIGIIRDGKIVQ